jgi:hypothetical protein
MNTFRQVDQEEAAMGLDWPAELVLDEKQELSWNQPTSNIVLDFHGDPLKAKLVVFSDGNHHMALLPALRSFYSAHPKVEDIFYATTPPGPIVGLLKNGALRLGNLTLSIRPHLFISPPHVLERLRKDGLISSHRLLASNQGSVLLVRKENPKRIASVADLMRADVRVFISNPDTETVSYVGYRRTLEGLAIHQGLGLDAFSQTVFERNVVWGHRIHHREAPEAVAAGKTDAAIVYYHLGLRYTRLFPDLFDLVPLGGTKDRPEPHPGNRIAAIHMGLVGTGGDWGPCLLEFMQSRAVAEIYAEHGLRHALFDAETVS